MSHSLPTKPPLCCHISGGIPILDLPPFQNVDVCTSAAFDYSQVFGRCNAFDFAVSYDDLFKHNSHHSSSNEPRTPAQNESLSDKSDPSGCSEKNQSLSHGDLHHSCDDRKQFNISYNKANPKGMKDISNGVTHVTQLDATPGYSCTIKQTSPSQYVEDESPYLHFERNADCDGVITEGKRLRKTVSQPPVSSFGLHNYENELDPLAGKEKYSSPEKAFVCASDLSLRTRPSHLQPPSGPPSFAERVKNSSRLNPKHKASKSYAFDRMETDYSPPYIDVEVDASSSAAASAAAMKDAVEKAQAQLSNAKELMERKKEALRNRTKSHLEKDIGHKGETNIDFDRFYKLKGERVPHRFEREVSELKVNAAEKRKNVRNTIRVASSATERKDNVLEERKELTQTQVPHKLDGIYARREATQSDEVVKEKKVVDANILASKLKSRDSGAAGTCIGAMVESQDHNIQTIAATMDHECQEIVENCEQVERNIIQIAYRGSVRKEEHQEKSKLIQRACEWQEKDTKSGVVLRHGEIDNKHYHVYISDNNNILTEDQLKQNEVISEGVNGRVKDLIKVKEAIGRKSSEMERKASFRNKECDIGFEADVKQVKDRVSQKKTLGQKAKEELEKEVNDSKHVRTSETGKHNESEKVAAEFEGKIKRSEDDFEQEGRNGRLRIDLKQQEMNREQKQQENKEQNCACEAEKNEDGLMMNIEQNQEAERQERASEKEASEKRPEDDIQLDEKRLKEAREKKEKWKRSRETQESDESEKRVELLFKEDVIRKRLSDTITCTDCKSNIKDERNGEGFSGQNCVFEQLKRDVSDIELNLNKGNCAIREEKKISDVVNLSSESSAGLTAGDIHKKWETNNKPFVCEEIESSKMEQKTQAREVEVKNEPVEERLSSFDMDENSLQYKGISDEKEVESLYQKGTGDKSKVENIDLIRMHINKSRGSSGIASDTENAHILTDKLREGRKNSRGNHNNQEGNKDKFTASQVVQESHGNVTIMENVLPAQKFTSHNPEVEETIIRRKIIFEEREKEERLKRERDLENDLLKKIEEEREREREREKDLLAVDTATHKARETAFAEARVRTERAAVERATAEVRQRVLTEARDRLEKASAEARDRLSADKASETRLKAERAAVERATAEARERAFEKAKAEKASNEAHERVERPVTDKFSSYSRNGGFRLTSSFNDLQNPQRQRAGPSRDFKYSHSSVSDGLQGESAQRSKARLDRYQRTAERAAKALAEKNIRDLLAEKEQTERNRLSESLDADVKRWSSGKQGNLRALLSTLQYILGPNSGWQPMPLTDVVTAAAVKKAYRKATLCVHPDKLQQRGASIQQKYICEKVFDLLKEAWNKFNSEER